MNRDFEKHIEEELKDFESDDVEFAKKFFGNTLKTVSRPMDYKGIAKLTEYRKLTDKEGRK